jgi:hypothetical protein
MANYKVSINEGNKGNTHVIQSTKKLAIRGLRESQNDRLTVDKNITLTLISVVESVESCSCEK